VRAAARVAVVVAAGLAVASARADAPAPPWVDPGDAPLPAWVRSVTPAPGARGGPGDMVLFAEPGRGSSRRGVTIPGATLPVFGARRGSGCSGRWWLVGPLAWACSDGMALEPGDPQTPPRAVHPDGLQREYYFVGSEGASAYTSVESAQEGAPDRELERGWAVAVVGHRASGGDRWALTSKGLWIAERDLGVARPSLFRGQSIGEGPFDLAWVLSERASVWSQPPGGAGKAPVAKAKEARARFEVVHVLEERGAYVRVADDAWMASRDLARPHLAPAPGEVARPGEQWIDVELATQTLVAYQGARPVYATLVSTGRGPVGTDAATPPGVHRIWVKLLASDMDNTERDDTSSHYSLEDVPYVQFFDKAVALHGTYWHRDFGHVKSHGCVNLSPLDAKWLFDFTGPRLPSAWAAAYPTPLDPGTVVRVR
jgi:lipoprotein-anchoring transpeptidase ErfK/SrfK